MAEFLPRSSAVLSALCKATGKWGLYVSIENGSDDPGLTVESLMGAASWLTREQAESLFMGDWAAHVLFDTEADMLDAFRRTVGDEGPTAENPYEGPVQVYAMTCGPDGELRDENT